VQELIKFKFESKCILDWTRQVKTETIRQVAKLKRLS
jgi:hypothetical protein